MQILLNRAVFSPKELYLTSQARFFAWGYVLNIKGNAVSLQKLIIKK